MDKFMPGALTIVLELKSKNPALNKIKGQTGIGLRYPDHSMAQSLVEALGKPITATSANLSSKPNNYSVAEVKKQFAKSKLKPDFYLDGGKLPKIKPSTVVAVAKNQVKILRTGPISEKQIKRALKM